MSVCSLVRRRWARGLARPACLHLMKLSMEQTRGKTSILCSPRMEHPANPEASRSLQCPQQNKGRSRRTRTQILLPFFRQLPPPTAAPPKPSHMALRDYCINQWQPEPHEMLPSPLGWGLWSSWSSGSQPVAHDPLGRSQRTFSQGLPKTFRKHKYLHDDSEQ